MSFINLLRHARLVQLSVNQEKLVYSTDYTSVEVPLLLGEKVTKEGREEFGPRDSVKANTRVKLIGNALFNPTKGYCVLLELNPLLFEVASCNYPAIVGVTSPEVSTGGMRQAPYVVCDFKKAFNLSELKWLFRLRATS